MLTALLICLGILFMLNMPIAFSIIAAISLYIFLSDASVPYTVIIQRMVTGIDRFVFLAIPFFILSGLIMQRGGLADRLIVLSSVLLKRLTGGFGMATSFASMIFSSISGSGPATTAAIGGSMLPALEKKGYGREWSVAFIASSGTMGPIIPPSITLVLFGAMANTSIGALFIGGILPGILIAMSLMFMSYLRAKKLNIKETDNNENISLWKALKDSLLALIMPIIIIGGIVGGIFTPTEASVISVVYAIIVCCFIYKSLNLKDLYSLFAETASVSAVIIILTANASVFAWILSVEQAPQKLINGISLITEDKYMILLLINLLLILIGCFMDTTSALIITVPTLLALTGTIGVDPLHLGLIMGVNLAIGMATPPLGFTLFTACSIGNVSISNTFRPILPMIGVMLVVVILVTYLPGVFLWLPNLLLN